jgi:penicillin amidase
LYGTWTSGYRAARIRQMIEARLTRSAQGFTGEDFRDMHQDAVSLRAVNCLPPLLAALSEMTDPQVQAAARHLTSWDGRVEADGIAPTLFNVFFSCWSKAVADVHFAGATAELLAKQAEGIASRLLAADEHGWFPRGQRLPRIRRVFSDTLANLTQRLGPDMSAWLWGRLHRLPLRHVLSNRGDLGQLLDHVGLPVKGDMTTVCNTGSDPSWLATSGAGYRLIADLGTNCLLAVDAQSQSGHPGSAHYPTSSPLGTRASTTSSRWTAPKCHSWLSRSYNCPLLTEETRGTKTARAPSGPQSTSISRCRLSSRAATACEWPAPE